MEKDNTKISWKAKEYVQQDKNGGWYVGLVLVGVVLVGLSIWQQWWTFTILVILSVVALIMYSVRPPREISYTLDKQGLTEGDKLYEYSLFKSFGILKEDENYSIVLIPKKRFSVRVTVYFPKTSGEKIVDAFGMRLPMEEVNFDIIDRIVKFLRI